MMRLCGLLALIALSLTPELLVGLDQARQTTGTNAAQTKYGVTGKGVVIAILDFQGRHATFTCSTQLVPYQRVQIFGTTGRIELDIPFNAPIDRPSGIVIDNGADLFGGGSRLEQFPVCDQYTLQGDAFSRAIQENGEVPVQLEDAISNMAVIEAVFRSEKSGQWERL